MNTPIEPPEDLRAAILSLPVGKFEDGSPMYLEDIFPYIATSDFADDILRPCEAAALAALPEMTLRDAIEAKMVPTPEEYEKMVWAIRWYKATAQANIHSVFGGSDA